MSGKPSGGIKGRDKILARDPGFYKRIGAMGGKKSRGGGFSQWEHADLVKLGQWAGKIGGRSKHKDGCMCAAHGSNRYRKRQLQDETK